MLRPPLVLAYHGLARVAAELDRHNLMLDPEAFRQQVLVLKRRKYEFVTVSAFARRIDGRPEPAPGLCALTFDDGTTDYADVLPQLLEELDVCATVYVCPGLLGDPNPFLAPDAGIRLLNADQLREVAGNPRIEVGSHTRRHVLLATATEQEAYDEMVASKRELEELIGAEVTTFAYPECAYSPACPGAAARAGYVAAVTCGDRGSWQPYELRRQPIDRLDNRATFELKSRGLWVPFKKSLVGRVVRRSVRRFRHPHA
jgi:peptidoglycan/xylan/chitin deacetylase (PgdA/CDA1 family)